MTARARVVGMVALGRLSNLATLSHNGEGENCEALADLRALLAERDALKADAVVADALAAENDLALAALRAQVESLTNALEGIANKDWSSLCADSAAEEMRDIARVALEGGAK